MRREHAMWQPRSSAFVCQIISPFIHPTASDVVWSACNLTLSFCIMIHDALPRTPKGLDTSCKPLVF